MQGRWAGGVGTIGGMSRRGFVAALLAMLGGARVAAQEFSALARVAGAPLLRAEAGGLRIELPLSQAVPFRLRHMADPLRLMIDFRQVDWAGFGLSGPLPASLSALRTGQAGGGWSRMVLELAQPMTAERAGLRVDADSGRALLELRLEPAAAEAFAARVAEDALRATASGVQPRSTDPLQAEGRRGALAGGRAVVVLDPGHGGIDPGAERGGLREADLMLTFAQELADVLRRSGDFDVVLTREADVFVSLEARIRIARRAGADLFVSLHADALADGGASGATVYTLSETATDAAAAALAERHDRDDLLGGGVDLSGTDDAVASVLMAIARAETQPGTDRLAQALVSAIGEAGLAMHRRPWQQAAFSVLKAPDIPSVLLEVGFMSSPRDLANLQDAAWRQRMAEAIHAAFDAWVAEEIVQGELRRR